MAEVLRRLRPAFGDVRIGLIATAARGRRAPVRPASSLARAAGRRDGRLAYPLTVKGRVAGVLEVRRRAPAATRPLLATLATQLSITLENARLYRELGTLFRQYMSPDVAAALLADPDQAALGGSVVEVTALFADLRGFTTFSEAVDPAEIVADAQPLPRRRGAVHPRQRRDDRAVRRRRAAGPVQRAGPAGRPRACARSGRRWRCRPVVEAIAAAEPGWPRLRVGANTGPALVGNIGSETLRGFNAMGDAVNVAARLQSLAEPGQVVIGESTRAILGDRIVPSHRWASSTVKGRQPAGTRLRGDRVADR